MTISVCEIADDERRAVGLELARLDAAARYPLGADFFHIDHGADYFAFFARLAAHDAARPLRTWIARDDRGELVGTITAVERTLPSGRRALYVGDLKVATTSAGRHVGLRLSHAFAAATIAQGAQAYAVSMDPADGENRVVSMLTREGVVAAVARLELFSLDAAGARPATDAMRAFDPCLAWYSLAGVKDIVLDSTRKPLALLHAQFGPHGTIDGDSVVREPRDGSTHMFCALAHGDLARRARASGLEPSATATLLATPAIADELRTTEFVLTSSI
ncbi:MAG: hypothetical protein IPH13_05915 [Planctomycetes bacterium]|nr:hypothetical protein [Planctomycetota bacterium]